MADPDDSVFDKAESLARRVLERLGSRIDQKLGSSDQQLNSRQVGELALLVEKAIESNLKEDMSGLKRVAPNRIIVLFTYEDGSRLSAQYLEALAAELTQSATEYVTNRRYETPGPVRVEAGSDVFAKATVVKASFEAREATGPKGARTTDHGARGERVTITLACGSSNYRVDLERRGAPAYVGRTAEVAVRVEDPSVSRLHCSLALRSNGDVVVADLGSANGTRVNGVDLRPEEARPVSPGDVITVGDVGIQISRIDSA